jgi:anti-sigma factor (TIGR02949 family)
MKMLCGEVERSLPWFLDDELDVETAGEIEEHLLECTGCRAVLEQEGRLRLVLRQAAEHVAVPASLRRRVLESIERERPQPRWARAWPAVAAAAVLVAFIWKGGSGSAMADLDVVSKVPDLPMDVVAADAASLQAYFSRKMPFAVRLPRIADGSVGTFGGRVMNLRDRDAAYVRYNLPRGQMSMFVYEDHGEDLPEVAPLYRIGNHRMVVKEVHGYTVARWSSDGLTYSVVTDLPINEFSTLVHASPPMAGAP